MSKMIIIEGNSNDKDNARTYMVKGEKGDMGDLNHNDIIDNVTSTATDKVLSAKQGKFLKDLIDNNKTDTDQKPYYFDNVEDMKDYTLIEGDMVITNGYYETNDGGGAKYIIVGTQSATEHQEELENGLYATLIVENEINPLQLGAYGDEIHDDTVIFQECIEIAENNGLILNGLNKNYLISDEVELPNTMSSVNEKGLYINNGMTLINCNFKLKNGVSDLTSILNIDVPTNESVIIDNVYINGNRTNQSSSLATQNGGLHGIRAGFSIENPGILIIKNCNIESCYTDGIVIRPRNFKETIIENCYIKDSGRNGITDNSINSIVKDCVFVDNGSRVAPKSGYHIEPDVGKDFGVKKLVGCNFYNSTSNDIAIYLNTNTFSFEKFIIDNCSTTTRVNIEGACLSQSIFKEIKIVNSNIGGILRIIKNDEDTLLQYDNIIIDNCRFARYINVAGNTDNNIKTNFTFNSSYIKADIRLNYNLNNVKIINSTFENDEHPSSDWTEVFCINPCFPKISSESTPYTINSLIVANNQVTFFRRLISNISSDTATPKNITNLQVTNNKTYFGSGVVILNEGEITNAIVSDNINYISSVGTLKKYQMGTTTNLIFKNNIGNFESSKALSNTSTALINKDNIWDSTAQV